MISRRGFLASSAAFLGVAIKSTKKRYWTTGWITPKPSGATGDPRLIRRGDVFTVSGAYEIDPLTLKPTTRLQRFTAI